MTIDWDRVQYIIRAERDTMDPIQNAAALRVILGNMVAAAESTQPGNPFGDIGHPGAANALRDAGLAEFDTSKARDIIVAIDDAIKNGKNDVLTRLVGILPTILDPKKILAGVATTFGIQI